MLDSGTVLNVFRLSQNPNHTGLKNWRKKFTNQFVQKLFIFNMC